MNIIDWTFGIAAGSLAIVVIVLLVTTTCMCGDIPEKNVTVLHKYTENTLGGTHYFFIDTDKTGYKILGDNVGVRFYLLECNHTYKIATKNGISCSEVKC